MFLITHRDVHTHINTHYSIQGVYAPRTGQHYNILLSYNIHNTYSIMHSEHDLYTCNILYCTRSNILKTQTTMHALHDLSSFHFALAAYHTLIQKKCAYTALTEKIQTTNEKIKAKLVQAARKSPEGSRYA